MSLDARTWKLTATYLDGHVEVAIGEIHLKDSVIEVRGDKQLDYGERSYVTTWVPMCNLRTATIEEYVDPAVEVHHTGPYGERVHDTQVLDGR